MTTTMMMNRLIALVAVCLIACGSAMSQTAAARTELTALLNEFLAGAGRNDAAIHDKFWAEDLIYTRSAGSRTNKPELMKGVRSAPKGKTDAPITIYKAEDVRIQQYGSTAVVAFRLVGTTAKMDGSKDVAQFLNTGTFVKRRGRWQAVAWQATAIPKPAIAKQSEDTKSTAVTPVAGRVYSTGPKGGCYYVNPTGKKTYVNKELCK